MKLLVVLLLSLGSLPALAAPSAMIRPTPGHPLLGKWEWTRDMNKCTEVYEFRADGSAPITSGTEKTDNVYTVAVDPDINSFYRLTLRTTKDFGGKDCADDTSDSTGTEGTNYIRFNPARDQYLSCYEAKLERCFGPLRRVAP